MQNRQVTQSGLYKDKFECDYNPQKYMCQTISIQNILTLYIQLYLLHRYCMYYCACICIIIIITQERPRTSLTLNFLKPINH